MEKGNSQKSYEFLGKLFEVQEICGFSMTSLVEFAWLKA